MRSAILRSRPFTDLRGRRAVMGKNFLSVGSLKKTSPFSSREEIGMENNSSAASNNKGFATWFGMSVAYAFFASLEQCSCIDLTTFESDEEYYEDANGRPLMFTNSKRSCSFSSTTTTAPKLTTVDATPV
ncbi:hypothetical protein Leryth_000200 [Lithospermum erythrorhizon]|nr:hypothetical protein Leryth_000200 [Lithospermum erythrorhizon]